MLDTFDAVRALPDRGRRHARRSPTPAATARRLQPGPAPDRSVARPRHRPSGNAFGSGLDSRTCCARCRDRGYEPTFHPETGTFVEAPWEIERVLELSDIGSVPRDGTHLCSGGGRSAQHAARAAPDRVNHVHLKDAVLARACDQFIADDDAQRPSIWSREVFCALGHGDLNLAAILDGLEATRASSGWLVVEQDIFPRTAERFAQATAGSTGQPRAYLAGRGRLMDAVFPAWAWLAPGRMGQTHLRALAGSGRVEVDGHRRAGRRAASQVSGQPSVPAVYESARRACWTLVAIDGVLDR